MSTHFPANHQLVIADLAPIRGNFTLLGGSATDQYRLVFGGNAAYSTNVSGDFTIITGLTTVIGCRVYNGNATVRGGCIFQNNRSAFPAVANGSIGIRVYLCTTGAVVASTAFTVSWAAWGIV